jgi:hypothetical protein
MTSTLGSGRAPLRAHSRSAPMKVRQSRWTESRKDQIEARLPSYFEPFYNSDWDRRLGLDPLE